MRIIHFNIIILLILINWILFASTPKLTGKILDLKTQNPISDVNIFIKEQNIGTTSDKDGYFMLDLNKFNKNILNLNIQVIGYEEKVLFIDLSKSNLDLGIIYMKSKSIALESVDIYSQNKSLNQISDVIIAGTELNNNLKGNIAATLSNHPNIGINSMGSVTSKPALRGFSGDRFLLTKDGIETGDLSQSSIDHAIVLDMTEVNQIEIIRGPKSLIYGPNAIGGVINTSLLGNPKIRAEKLYHKLLIGTESFNKSLYGNVMYYIPIKNNQVNLFISNRKTKNEVTPLGELYNTKSNSVNYKLGFTHYINNDYINFIIEKFNMDYGIPPTSNGHINGVDIFMLKNSYQINFLKNIEFAKFDLKYNSIDYQHVELVNNDEFNYNIYEIIDSNLYHVYLSKKTDNLKIEFNSINSTLGSEYAKKVFKPDGYYLTPTTDEIQLSIYGYKKRVVNNFDLDLLTSFRFSYLWIDPDEYNYSDRNANLVLKDADGNPIEDQYGNEISLVKDREFKNVSLSFGLNKNYNQFQINSWFMYTMRAPRVEELYSDGPHLASYAFEIGNPNLKSEKIYGIENSISFVSHPINFSVVTFFNYSPYYFEMTKNGHCEVPKDWKPWTTHPCFGADWIDWGSGGLGWLHKYSAKGSEVIIKGFEFDLGYKVNKINFRYNLSFVQGDNKTLKVPLSYMNPMKQILHIDYKNNFMNYKIRFSKINAQNRLGEFETHTPGSFLTDFIISINYNKQNMTIQLNNFFDIEYYNHLSRIKNIAPESGRNFHLVYKLFI